MILDKLLKHITPLPYERRGAMIYGPDNGPGTAKNIADGDSPDHIAYLVHAANQLPGCVATMKECLAAAMIHRAGIVAAFLNPPPELQDVLDGLDITIDKLRKSITAAETIP